MQSMTTIYDKVEDGAISAAKAQQKGTYIAVEGIDGSGKSTVVDGLQNAFPDAVFTAEPKEEMFTGQAVRDALVSETGPYTDALLFMADRAEHIHRLVRPAMQDGALVVSDRSAASTYAYQAERVPCVDPELWFDQCYAPWDLEPDLTIYLDVEVATAMERLDGEEKYEKRQFLREVQSNYDSMYLEATNWERIDAERPEPAVVSEAITLVESQL